MGGRGETPPSSIIRHQSSKMAASRYQRRRRRIAGLLPWLAWRLRDLVDWAWHHPRPIVTFGVTVAVVWGLWGYAQRADAFRITQVSMPSQVSLALRAPLIGTNLWDLDLQALAGELSRQQPSLKRVRVVRQLPNAIRIEAIPRMPVAQVKVGTWHPVDAEGFILSGGSSQSPSELVRIMGADGGETPLRVGSLNRSERLEVALRVLKVLRRAPALVSRRLTDINVSDPRQIRFVLDGNTEVRCGSETELSAQLDRLHATLKTIARHQMAVRYIDLRFGEPVVHPAT